MFDLIKPNKEWKKLSMDLNGTFTKGNFFSPCKMTIPYKSEMYSFETNYSGDNFWRGQTIAVRDFHYLQDFKMSIKCKLFSEDSNGLFRIVIDKKFDNQKQAIQKMESLRNLQNDISYFSIKFMTEGIISNDYEVLPILKFKCNGYIIDLKQIKLILGVLHDLSEILEKEKIIKSSA
nr:hypothetical protein [uncultured Draconibacterium sp.]